MLWASQCARDSQSTSEAHEFGQTMLTPLHAEGAGHFGEPTLPAVAGEHVPSFEAPSAAEQTSHELAHEESQQKPSTQWPVSHTRHPATLQSCPAVTEQGSPPALRDWHELSGAQ